MRRIFDADGIVNWAGEEAFLHKVQDAVTALFSEHGIEYPVHDIELAITQAVHHVALERRLDIKEARRESARNR